MSSQGLAFRCRRPLPVGAHVEMVIEWPVQKAGLYPVELEASGLIVRSGAARTAVRLSSWSFQALLSLNRLPKSEVS
jgi:hypothetical protein